jgi:hypothetical protein
MIQTAQRNTSNMSQFQRPTPRSSASPVIAGAITTAMTSTPSTPISRTFGEPCTEVRARRRIVASASASRTTLTAAEPRRSFTVRAGAPRSVALVATASSGSEVAPPSSSSPAISWPMPVLEAIASTQWVSRTPASQTAIAAPTKRARFEVVDKPSNMESRALSPVPAADSPDCRLGNAGAGPT